MHTYMLQLLRITEGFKTGNSKSRAPNHTYRMENWVEAKGWVSLCGSRYMLRWKHSGLWHWGKWHSSRGTGLTPIPELVRCVMLRQVIQLLCSSFLMFRIGMKIPLNGKHCCSTILIQKYLCYKMTGSMVLNTALVLLTPLHTMTQEKRWGLACSEEQTESRLSAEAFQKQNLWRAFRGKVKRYRLGEDTWSIQGRRRISMFKNPEKGKLSVSTASINVVEGTVFWGECKGENH